MDDAPQRTDGDVAAPVTTPGPGDVAPVESLTLTQALAALDAQHPDLAALRHQVDAAAARAEAAGAFPAPAALIRAENVPLNRGSSFDQGNYIAGLAFDLPLQGRLSAARAVEERDGELVSRELEVTRHELQRAARDAFATALAAQRAAEYHEDAAGSAERLARLLDRRVARGDLAPDEATWAAVEAARSRLEAELLADELRPEAAATLARLQADGLRLIMLTGDRAASALDVAARLGIDEVHADLLPEDKLRIIRALQRSGRRVCFVGDGINDAPALVEAHVGAALQSGTDVAMETADVLLMTNDLSRLGEALRESRRSQRVILFNFGGTLAVDLIGIGLAAFGFLGPLLSAIIHVGSELVFILNSARLFTSVGTTGHGQGPACAGTSEATEPGLVS